MNNQAYAELDKIKPVEQYRGVDIHDCQPAQRVEKIVKPAIDDVMSMHDLKEMHAYAADITRPPEARLLAAAKCSAVFQVAVDERRERPAINIAEVRAAVSGLDSVKWRSSTHYCSILDPVGPSQSGSRQPEAREVPLAERVTERA